MPSERAVSSKSPSVTRCTEYLPGKSSTLHRNILRRQQRGRALALPQNRKHSELLQLFLVDGLLQLDTGSEFRHSPGGNLNDTAGLRITPIARLALRNREGPEAYQGHAVAFLQRRRYRIYDRIDRASSRSFADAVRAGDLFHQVPFVHPRS